MANVRLSHSAGTGGCLILKKSLWCTKCDTFRTCKNVRALLGISIPEIYTFCIDANVLTHPGSWLFACVASLGPVHRGLAGHFCSSITCTRWSRRERWGRALGRKSMWWTPRAWCAAFPRWWRSWCACTAPCCNLGVFRCHTRPLPRRAWELQRPRRNPTGQRWCTGPCVWSPPPCFGGGSWWPDSARCSVPWCEGSWPKCSPQRCSDISGTRLPQKARAHTSTGGTDQMAGTGRWWGQKLPCWTDRGWW